MNSTYSLLTFALLSLLMIACPKLENETDLRIILEDNKAILSQRLTQRNEIVALDSVPQMGRSVAAVPDTIILTLVAEVDPPIWNGDTLQANDVKIKGKRAYVAYNVAGETFLGGVDVFDIDDIYNPTLISQALFTDTDVNGLTFKNDYIYLASATNGGDYSSPAILERIAMNNGVLTTNSTIVDIPSWAATDVDIAGNYIFVSSGADNGYVTTLDLSSLAKIDSLSVEDARGVDSDGNDIGVVAGTPAQLVIFDKNSGEVVDTYSLSGANIDFSKSTVKLRKRKAILGLGDGGTQIVCLDNGNIIDEIPQPELDDLPLSKTVTNSVSADKRLLFIANGEAGVYVAATNSNLNDNTCSLDSLHLVGKFRIGDGLSANHVEYNNDVLFVASGLGGLKIFTVDMNNNDEDDDDEDDN